MCFAQERALFAESRPEKGFGFGMLSLLTQSKGQVAHGNERIRMFLTQDATPGVEDTP
jgi:hypothetical protein